MTDKDSQPIAQPASEPLVDEVMRLADRYHALHGLKAEPERAALESAIRSLVKRPVSGVKQDEVEAMCAKLELWAGPDQTSVLRQAAAMLRQQGESYRMLTAVYNRFVDGRALSVDAIQRHDFTGQDAQRNSQDGNSVVLSADEWDAYRADLNTYSQILALLGMEEEGDPVLAVKLLMQVKHD